MGAKRLEMSDDGGVLVVNCICLRLCLTVVCGLAMFGRSDGPIAFVLSISFCSVAAIPGLCNGGRTMRGIVDSFARIAGAVG